MQYPESGEIQPGEDWGRTGKITLGRRTGDFEIGEDDTMIFYLVSKVDISHGIKSCIIRYFKDHLRCNVEFSCTFTINQSSRYCLIVRGNADTLRMLQNAPRSVYSISNHQVESHDTPVHKIPLPSIMSQTLNHDGSGYTNKKTHTPRDNVFVINIVEKVVSPKVFIQTLYLMVFCALMNVSFGFFDGKIFYSFFFISLAIIICKAVLKTRWWVRTNSHVYMCTRAYVATCTYASAHIHMCCNVHIGVYVMSVYICASFTCTDHGKFVQFFELQ